MNKLNATVQSIESAQGSTLIRLAYGETVLSAITLMPPMGLYEGGAATLIVHETRPILTHEPIGGIANTLIADVTQIEEGEMLTRVVLSVENEMMSILVDSPTYRLHPCIIGERRYIGFKATDIAIEVAG